MHREDQQRFPLPHRPSAWTFERSFDSLNGTVNIIIDEANNLGSVEADTLEAFFSFLRKLKHNRLSQPSGLGALILVGTEELLSTVRKGVQTTPFNYVSSVLVTLR